jgi:hypothetical protein
MDVVIALSTCVVTLIAAVFPLIWTVRRILRPIDQAAKVRDAPFRFSIGDFLCLFWIVQLPLAFVFQIDAEETEVFYWVLMIAVWAVAPLVWFTCARTLSKASISTGIHRFIFLALVVPTVYYGLFPFVGLSVAGVAALAVSGPSGVLQYSSAIMIWVALAMALAIFGFYSPWLVRQASSDATTHSVSSIEFD